MENIILETVAKKSANSLVSLVDSPSVSANATKFAKSINSLGVSESKYDNIIHLTIVYSDELIKVT